MSVPGITALQIGRSSPSGFAVSLAGGLGIAAKRRHRRPPRAEATLQRRSEDGFRRSAIDSAPAIPRPLSSATVCGRVDRRSAVRDGHGAWRGRPPVLRATIGLAHTLGPTVVAEGVQTQATLEPLRSPPCDEAQGSAVSKPPSARPLPAAIDGVWPACARDWRSTVLSAMVALAPAGLLFSSCCPLHLHERKYAQCLLPVPDRLPAPVRLPPLRPGALRLQRPPPARCCAVPPWPPRPPPQPPRPLGGARRQSGPPEPLRPRATARPLARHSWRRCASHPRGRLPPPQARPVRQAPRA